MKRQRVGGYNDGGGYIPFVEKLYRKTQEDYETAGGFMGDDDEYEEVRERVSAARQRKVAAAASASSVVPPDGCIDCGKALYESYLWDKFNYAVCDSCRDEKGTYKLLSRTEAKNQYLLKDCDLDMRKPILRFISKKNPHNPRYGDMKLYLKAQLEQRCLEIYGTKENFEKIKEERASQKEIKSEKRFEKKIREMRQQVCGPKRLKPGQVKVHDHDFDEETYDADKDEFFKVCKICDYTARFEKM